MNLIIFLCLFFSSNIGLSKVSQTVLVEAENFNNKGGWVIDQQSMDVMGSPYLMAHGMGIPVQDAETTVKFRNTGKYYVFVRTRNWTAAWSDKAAGRFQLSIDGYRMDKEFGIESADWSWEAGGSVEITTNDVPLTFHDLTGFNGRCDAIYFTMDKNDIPPSDVDKLDDLRAELLNLNKDPEEASYDFVIVGGGMAGTCAAISAARLGVKVALIQKPTCARRE
jgi:hypothetical protein